MTRSSGREITHLLKMWADGDDSVLDELLPLVYNELRRMAHRQMLRERKGHSFESTDLVNEGFLRFVNTRQVQWKNKDHFFACFATIMRRVLVDHARSRCRQKRKGALNAVALDLSAIPAPKKDPDVRITNLDDALNRLEEIDERKARVVEMRYFGGFSVAETAEALKISERTVMNEWKFAQAWLLKELQKK